MARRMAVGASARWAPLVSLEEGLRRTLDWYRDRLPDYAPRDVAAAPSRA